jgi:hypothetical protein
MEMSGAQTGLRYKGRLLALSTTVTNTLDYFGTKLITIMKSFTIVALRCVYTGAISRAILH